MRALPLLALLALFALPTVPAQDDGAAWLAARLGVLVEDLPQEFAVRSFRVHEGEVRHQDAVVALPELAQRLRDGPWGASVDVVEAPTWAGVGLGASGGPGVRYAGAAVGPTTMPCATYTATPSHVRSPLASGGMVNASVRLDLPTQGAFTSSGTATMEALLVPAPAPGPAAVTARSVQAEVLAGHGFVGCGISFTLRIATGMLRGEGVLHSPMLPGIATPGL